MDSRVIYTLPDAVRIHEISSTDFDKANAVSDGVIIFHREGVQRCSGKSAYARESGICGKDAGWEDIEGFYAENIFWRNGKCGISSTYIF